MRNRGGADGQQQRGGVSPGGTSVRVARWGESWRVIVGAGSGAGRRRVTTCASRAEADAVAARIVEQVEAGALLEADTGPEPQRVGELLEAFVAMVDQDPRKRKWTRRNYRGRAHALTGGLGQIPIRSLSRQTLVRYVAQRRAEGRRAAGIESDIRTLRTALRWGADRWGWQTRTSSMVVGLEYGPRTRRRALSMPEVEALREAMTFPPGRVAFELGVQAGLRAGEVISRTWADLDGDRRTLWVGDHPEHGYRVKTGDGGNVPLTVDLARILAAEYLRQGRPELDAPIVPTFWGSRRESTDGLLSLLHEACDRAHVQRVPFHALRHTCGSRLIEAGVDLVIVSRILRHASVAITERVYIHVHDRQLVRAADQLEAFLSQAANGPATANGRGA
jgi:integrase